MKCPRFSMLLLLLFLSSCSILNPEPTHYSTENHFKQAEELMAQEKYKDAIKHWEKVLEAYASPQLNMLAELKIAEAHYLAEEYPEAVTAYEDFLKRHPQERRTPDIIFYLGMSYYQQRLSHDRDQTATYSALVTFQNLVRSFPDSINAGEANEKIRVLRKELADHDFYIGNFYYRTKKYQAATLRFEQLLKDYPDYTGREKTYFYLGRAYFELDKMEKGVEVFNTLSRNYPDSPYIAEAQKYLSKN